MSNFFDDLNNKFENRNYIVLSKEELNSIIEEAKGKRYRSNYEVPGHFYSPIPDINEIVEKADKIWKPPSMEVPGVRMNPDIQYDHLKDFFELANSFPFPEEKSDKTRYYYNNHSYSYADGISLHSMIRKYKPRRIIEIGSGFSSCVMADTNELFFNNTISLTFIEPNPEFFFSVFSEKDRQQNCVLVQKVQDVDLAVYDELEENDILFIDSSHVGKIGSDVNHEFFEIMPRLKKGVLIHFHDIFHPFEYPYDWIMEGRAMNENYMLKTFLQYNESFEILFMSTFVSTFFKQEIEENMPIFLKNSGGNFWMKKVK
jgi:predicted O-methyltransferase YrrM